MEQITQSEQTIKHSGLGKMSGWLRAFQHSFFRRKAIRPVSENDLTDDPLPTIEAKEQLAAHDEVQHQSEGDNAVEFTRGAVKPDSDLIATGETHTDVAASDELNYGDVAAKRADAEELFPSEVERENDSLPAHDEKAQPFDDLVSFASETQAISPTKASIDIDALVEMELPPLPGSALRVALLSMDMSVSTTAVAEAIGCDPILATRILRAANSPLYAVERSFTSLLSAVNALGNIAINQLVIIYAVSDAFHQNAKHARFERPLWRHSVAVGVAAREISGALGLRCGEEAFLCGLLHDIGKLLLLRHNADIYAQVDEAGDEQARESREEEIYGFTHAEVGALVANRWGLADEIGRAIFDHHLPTKDDGMPLMTLIIDAADQMTNVSGMGLRDEPTQELATPRSFDALGLSADRITEIWERAQVRMDEMMHVLSSLI